MSPPLRAVGWQPPHVWLTMTESWGLGRQRNSLTRTVQRLRLPGERFPALNSRGTKSWRRKRLLKAAHIHRASHLQGEALKLNCRAFISQFLRWLFYLKKKKRKEGREGGRREISVTAAPLGPAPGVGRASAQGWGHASLPARVGRGQPQGPAIKPMEGHWQPLELAQLVASARRGGGDGLERRVAGGPSCKQSPWGYFQALFPVRKEWEECSPAVTQIPPP